MTPARFYDEAVRHLLQPAIVFVRYLPQLTACYLLGLLGRTGAIEWAAWAGYDNDLWASLIMPLAGIARLGSYVAMFLVLRSGIPALAALPHRPLRQANLFATIIVPFFAIYLAWQMFRDDWLAFEVRALPRRIGDAMTTEAPVDLHPDMLPVSTVTWVLIVLALVTRFLLGKLKGRPANWLLPLRVYVDALWVFLALSFSASHGVTFLINPAGWIADRRIIVWFNSTLESLFSHFRPLETGWDAAMWVIKTVLGGAAVPLIWLAVAGIVYGVSATAQWRTIAEKVGGARTAAWVDRTTTNKRFESRWKRVPRRLREIGREQVESHVGKFKPIVDTAHVIVAAGVLPLAVYVLAYLGLAWLDIAGSFYRAQLGSGYLLRGISWALGPHDITFWFGTWDAIATLSHALVEPLRICLIACMFGYCVERLAAHEAEKAGVTAGTGSESRHPA